MANHPSALKRHRQSVKHRAQNIEMRAKVKAAIKKLKVAKKDDVANLLRQVSSLLHKAAQKGVIHKRNASRRISRLTKSTHKKAA
ncbi:MAG TPA: 30S ribosomal protein S20 [Deltaproteobacteria bacterium]|nr:MAG: 30S ribosomal protein S20 [Deltaproteobacteria bacterium GWA2_45_12]HBF13188.1 30S ribosomal protein S20 [Deltaproteobacteria bacterium]